MLTEDTGNKLNTKIHEPTRILLGPNHSELEVIGESEVLLSNKGLEIEALVSVVRGTKRNLLGILEIRKLNLLAVVNSISNESNVFDPYSEFAHLFKGLGTMPGIFKIDLREDTRPFRLCAPRSIPAGLREKAKTEINNMLSLGVIEPIEKPTEWCSGLTIAPKANGAIRMCVDLTQLNKGVKRELYPLPRVSDMLSLLAKGRMFSKLDANSGFWQVILEKESRLLTTFLTPWGRFCFKRMPFGITSAPEYFQRKMEQILVGLEGVICMMDDILVFGSTPREHWQRLRIVLERISEAKIISRRGFTCKERGAGFDQYAVAAQRKRQISGVNMGRGAQPDRRPPISPCSRDSNAFGGKGGIYHHAALMVGFTHPADQRIERFPAGVADPDLRPAADLRNPRRLRGARHGGWLQVLRVGRGSQEV